MRHSEKLSTEQAYYVTTNDILPLKRQLAEQKVDEYRQLVEKTMRRSTTTDVTRSLSYETKSSR